MYCNKCGAENINSASFCKKCGAALSESETRQNNMLDQKDTSEIPVGISGWSWGAFLWCWIWAIFNKTWVGLLSLIPYAGFIMQIILGIKGREWAWKNKHWESIEQFNKTQRKWSMWGLLFLIIPVLGVLSVAILATINPIEQVDRAKDARTKNDAAELLNANERYYAVNNKYPWTDNSNVNKGYATEDIANETWVNLLISSGEINKELIEGLRQDTVKLLLVNTAGLNGGAQNICFLPKSENVKNEAKQTCANSDAFTNQHSEYLCQSTQEYICIP